MKDLHERHMRLVEQLDTTDAVRAAFADHPRHLYVPDLIWPVADGLPLHRTADPERWARCVYALAPVTTQTNDGGSGPSGRPSSSSSHPQVMADMIAAAGVGPGSRVLEIGTGTGWNAAVLASLVGPTGSVVSTEIDPGVAGHANRRLAATGVRVVNGAEPSEGVYDAVLSTCAVSRVPEDWIAHVPTGGTVVAPWAPRSDGDSTPIAVLRKTADGRAEGPFLCDAVFMHDRTQRIPGDPFPGIGAEPEATGTCPVTSNELIQAGLITRLMLMLPGTRVGVGARPFDGGIGSIVYLGAPDASWAYLWPDGSFTSGGGRDLAGELTRVHTRFVAAGRPPLTAFSLETEPERGLHRVRAPASGPWDH